jgi:hypothetical protein
MCMSESLKGGVSIVHYSAQTCPDGAALRLQWVTAVHRRAAAAMPCFRTRQKHMHATTHRSQQVQSLTTQHTNMTAMRSICTHVPHSGLKPFVHSLQPHHHLNTVDPAQRAFNAPPATSAHPMKQQVIACRPAHITAAVNHATTALW